jgi:predicted CXXCH cytochrome family protein
MAFLVPLSCEKPIVEKSATTQPAESLTLAEADFRDALAGGIIGSKHDFSRDPKNPRDLCLTCHTPHITAARAPLLDRAPRPSVTVALRQAFGAELSSASLLCLSCHDGVTAKDVYTSSHATTLAEQLGSYQIGSRALSSHPIGFKYPIAEQKYHSIAVVEADGRIRLPGDRVQCTSCHDPHNTERHPKMLVKSNRRSGLCLSCHRI